VIILIFKIVWKCGYNTGAYELCRSAYVHTLRVSNLLTVYYLQLFKQMTQTLHSRSCIKKSPLHRIKCVRWCGLCLCYNDWTRIYCYRRGSDGDTCFKVRGRSNGMNEPAQRRTTLFVLGIEFWWLVNWNGVKQIRKHKITREIRNTHIFSLKTCKEKALLEILD